MSMKTTLTCFLFTTLLVCGGEKPAPEPSVNFARFEDRDHGFSVVFPGEPKRKFRHDPTGTHPIAAYTLKVSPQLALLVTCQELPAAAVQNPARTLEESVRGAAIEQKGTVVSQSETRQSGSPAREYEIDCETLMYRGRFIIAGSRLYNIAAF